MLLARIEHLYIACVAFTFGAAGTAAGFALGVVPYYRAQFDLPQYDGFFAASVALGTLVGFVVGALNGPKWFRAAEVSPLIQRRMLAYLQRRNAESRGVPQRTINTSSLRRLVGSPPPRKV